MRIGYDNSRSLPKLIRKNLRCLRDCARPKRQRFGIPRLPNRLFEDEICAVLQQFAHQPRAGLKGIIMRCFIILLVILVSAVSLAHSSPATTQTLSPTVTALMLDTNQPVPGAKITWEGDGDLKGSGQTSADGQCQITGIPTPCHWIDVKISQPGMVPLRIFWNDSKNASLLQRFAFGMEKGAPISGLVVDDSGQPIPNAHVVVEIRKKYPNSDQSVNLSWKQTRADDKGHWSIDGVPANATTVWICAYDLNHLDDEFFSPVEFKPRSQLFDGSARLTLPRGTPVNLTVLKPDGSPASAATILLGGDRHVANAFDEFKADSTGHASFGGKSGLTIIVTATLNGFGPAQANVSITDKPQPVTIKLTPLTTRSIEVVDPDGKPISGAEVEVSAWNRDEVFVHSDNTDATGNATWKDGPADGITANIYADGFTGRRELDWPANQTPRVVLMRPTNITARVTDADTGQPIPLFSVRTAAVSDEDGRPVWQKHGFFQRPNQKQPGQFTIKIDEPAHQYLFRVIADGYLPGRNPALRTRRQGAIIRFEVEESPAHLRQNSLRRQ